MDANTVNATYAAATSYARIDIGMRCEVIETGQVGLVVGKSIYLGRTTRYTVRLTGGEEQEFAAFELIDEE